MDTASAQTYHDLTRDVSRNLSYLRAELPDVLKGFNDLGKAASKAGVLDEKTKELIAIALGVAGHCDACIGFHVKALVRLGGTKKELAEALSMAVYMGGGPSLMYAANTLAAYDEFAPAPAAATPIAA
ncbi:MAG: carboxymuconolactone decarboxylase family protein [Burkholderiales bacterium]